MVQLIPFANFIETFWETSIEMRLRITEAQFLCWASGEPLEAAKVEPDYKIWKNYISYTHSWKQIPFLGAWIEVIFLLGFTDTWFDFS